MKIKEEGRNIYSFRMFSPAECADALRLLAKRPPRWRDAPLAWSDDLRPVVDYQDGLAHQAPLGGVSSLKDAYRRAVESSARPAAMLCWEYRVFRFATRQALLLRYGPGGHFIPHIDCMGTIRGRIISLVCYLNADYDGGRTYFPRQNVRVDPEPGKAVIFPSGITHPHGVEKVASGTKFVIVDWLS